VSKLFKHRAFDHVPVGDVMIEDMDVDENIIAVPTEVLVIQ
jgi:hypothetical protein